MQGLTPSVDEVDRLAAAITSALRERPLYFMDLVRAHRDRPYRTLLLAWGRIRERHRLARDDDGRYFLPTDSRPTDRAEAP